jgi:hypothetical protein
MEFSPGEYDLVAVAHEQQTDTLLSTEVHGAWPKLEYNAVSIGPIAVSQSLPGGFLRNGVEATHGAVIVADDEPLRPESPTAVMALVCRSRGEKRQIRVVRTLMGEEETPVGTTDLDLTSERCAQLVDLIPEKSLGAGRYRFLLRVYAGGDKLAEATRSIVVP